MNKENIYRNPKELCDRYSEGNVKLLLDKNIRDILTSIIEKDGLIYELVINSFDTLVLYPEWDEEKMIKHVAYVSGFYSFDKAKKAFDSVKKLNLHHK